MPPKEKYTHPKLRDQIKEELMDSDKGGAPGQWSARKAQMMAAEYKKRGGGYNQDKETGQDESQANLSKWTEEEWQTKEGSGNAKKSDGTQKRYLPKKAWEKMDEQEKQETDKKKQKESKQGKQFVANTKNAKEARQEANQEETEDFEAKKQTNTRTTRANTAKKRSNGTQKTAEGDEVQHDTLAQKRGTKRGSATEEAKSNNKKRKTNSSSTAKSNSKQSSGSKLPEGVYGTKHDKDEAPAPVGSTNRLPKVGQKVTWKAMPGFVHGRVTEIVRQSKQVNGKRVKASKDDPRIVMEAESGKICVHKPEVVFFD